VRAEPWPDLCVLKATIDLTFHRLGDVRRDLDLAPGAAESSHGWALLADVALQEGRLEDARRGYEELVRDNGSWDDHARLAHLEGQLGAFDLADELYSRAEDELTAKQLRSYAWVELQRGLLKVARGQHDGARRHYERADRAFSGHWLVAQHSAALLAAEGRIDEAVELMERLAERVPKPELRQLLGGLYEHAGRAQDALASRELALAAYRDSALRGQVHYLHHLVELYADGFEDGPQAVRWALEDVRLRGGPSTHAALGWARYRNGEIEPAVESTRRALDSGIVHSTLFRRAATVYEAAGRHAEAETLAGRAAALGPHGEHVHVH
jgi:tetratricopeptide (TPR) repeat protein